MLLDILKDVAASFGEDINDPSQKPLVITRVNKAAEELYACTDLAYSLREQVFDLNTDSNQVSLPNYVGELRGMRHYDWRQNITVVDMQPRYHFGIGNEVWPMQFRMLDKSPIARNIENESTITVSIPIAEPSEFVVTIIGSTSNSAKIIEKLTFAVGDLSKISTGNFTDIFEVRKDKLTLYDITLKDIEDNILGVIPNNEFYSLYHIFQVLDSVSTNTNVIEVLYKQRFSPFNNDEDTFVCGDVFDKAIFWKYFEHESARQKDTKGAIAALQKCVQVINQINQNVGAGLEKKINFGPNKYAGMTRFAINSLRRPRGIYCANN